MTLNFKIDEKQLGTFARLLAKELQSQSPMPKKPVTLEEAVELTGLSESTIRRRIKAKEWPSVPGVGRTLIPAAFMERVLDGTTKQEENE